MEQTHQCMPAELEQVMDLYGPTVYRLAYAQLRSSADAEDIYQEVFLRYYRKRPIFENEAHRKAWLLRVTLNASRSFLSSAWRRHTVPMEQDAVMPEPELQDMAQALSQLRVKDRQLLHLYYYEELSTRQIALLLQRKEGTVRTQLTRARVRLGKLLKGEDFNESDISEDE